MTAQGPIDIRKIDHTAERVYIHESYVVTFGPDGTSTDLWTLSNDGRALAHFKTLKPLHHPGVITPIVDIERNIVAISKRSSGAPELHVFDLATGDPLRTLMLYGSLDDMRMPYSSRLGFALVSTQDADELPHILVVDIAGNGWIEGAAYIPPDLRTSTDRLSPQFGAKHIADDGAVICSYVAPLLPNGVDHFTLMRWDGIPHENSLPTARADFPITLEDGEAVFLSPCLPLRDNALLISACETPLDAIETAYSRSSVLRAVDIRTLDALWTAEPLWGIIRRLYHAVDANVVIATGTQNARQSSSQDIPVSFIAAFDDQTGALLRLERINWNDQGADIRLCAATQDTIVVVFDNGDMSVTSVDDFLVAGLTRDADTQKVITIRLWQDDGREVVHAAVAKASVVVTTQANLVVVSW